MASNFRLTSGRNLSYQVRGSKRQDATPFVYLHGTPSAYPVLDSMSAACEKHNLQVISYSRSGYGESSRHSSRNIVDVVDDVEQLLRHLGAANKPCVVGGWSGGGKCSSSRECALCVAGVAPYDAEGLDWLEGQGEDNVAETKAALAGEEPLREYVESQRSGLLNADADGIIKEMSSILPEADKRAIKENEELGGYLVQSFRVALEHSPDGWIDDSLAFIKPWGFELSEIKVPVFLYQGSLDLMVPYGHGKWLAKHLPQQTLTKHLIEHEGHISIWLGNMEMMMEELSSVL
ncbi:hypothetical protein ANO11243_056330 [Dothideomycetidae sp. 11243]|nr:hypothetical protein ANO11243_056330 [fungal sp. No.11243]